MQFYSSGLYNKTIINSFVQIGALTADDYQEITGEKYAAPNA